MTGDGGRQDGFTLVEVMISALITLVVMSVAFSTFDNAMDLHDAATQLSESSQNLRVGTNLLVREFLQAGRDIPIGGIAIPSGANAAAIYRPSPPNQAYTFNNTTATTLSAITTGNAKGPVVAGAASDIVTIVTDDPLLGPLTVSPAGAAAGVPQLSVDGGTIDVGSSTGWIAGDPLNGISPMKAGDLVYFSAPGGTAIQTVTAVDGSIIAFDQGDPFNFNQRNAAAGSIRQILGATMAARRVFMYTYYVEEASEAPRLMRRLNMFPAQALAGVVEGLEFKYDIVDGVNPPLEVDEVPFTANGVTYTASQLRKVTLRVNVRSEFKSTTTHDYFRNYVSTVVALRNLAYIDRYK